MSVIKKCNLIAINQHVFMEQLKPRRLLIKLATGCAFKFNSRFLKQLDGCTMERPLSVTFSDIYMVKIENVVIPSKPFFYHRFVDDIRDLKQSLWEYFRMANLRQKSTSCTFVFPPRHDT